MLALQRLQEKIEEWRVEHEAIKNENARLKIELSTLSSAQSDKETEIGLLELELEEKDTEIEKIIAQVEALLS